MTSRPLRSTSRVPRSPGRWVATGREPQMAWCAGFAGLPFDPRVREVINSQRAKFEELGCRTEEAHPDFSGADELSNTW